jgi:carboxyl-terminal processing protease
MEKKTRETKHNIYLALVSVIVLVGFLSFKSIDFRLSKSLDIFFSFFREVSIFYVDKPDPEKLVQVGIEAMLESLDPYNEFIPEENRATLEFQTTGEYGGMGALIRQNPEYPIIAEVYEGSPAQKAGLMAGDMIMEINGESVFNTTVDKVSNKLKGVPNSNLKVVVKRLNQTNPLTFEFKRDKIHIPSVPFFGMVTDDLGYIRLSSFTTNSHNEVKSALKELKSKGKAKGIIFDLRGNPGGLLNEAVKVVSLFVNKDELVVYTKGQIKEFDQEYKTESRPVDSSIPLVVLVDRVSASASEIVAGALQDLDRAVVIGERTFGKGLVQATRPLPYNSQLKITTAKYYIPSGRCIQALDFTQRNEDGSIGNIPDSLITEFKTRNGRVVRDGGGITPDVTHNISIYSRLASVLYARNHIFDFATMFRHRNNAIDDPRSFSLSEDEYKNFVNYLNSIGFEYQSQTEQLLGELVKTSQQEKFFDILQALTDSIRSTIKQNEALNYESFKPEIKRLIEEEIISRYYYQKGKAERNILNDDILRKSIEILTDPSSIQAILSSQVQVIVLKNSGGNDQKFNMVPAFTKDFAKEERKVKLPEFESYPS